MTAALLLALLQDSIVIELVETPERVSKVVKTQEEESHLSERKDGGTPQEHKTSASSTHEYEETVLKVEGGRAASVRRRYLQAVETFTDAAKGRPTERRASFHGKSVTLTRDGARTQVEGDGITKPDQVELRLSDDPALEGLPAKPVGPGSRWPIDSRRLASRLAPQLGNFSITKASGSTTFREWQDLDKERCALLESEIRVEAASDRGPRVAFTQTMRYWYSPAHKAIVKVESDGRQELSGSAAVGGATFTYGGGSTTRYTERRTFP